MPENKYSAKRIDAVLDFGRIYNGSAEIILFIAAALCLAAPVSTGAIGIAAAAGAADWNKNFTIGAIALNVVSVLTLAYLVYVIINNFRNRKKVDEWLCDAVGANALIRRVPPDHEQYVRNRLSVAFELNGEKHFIMSVPRAWAKDINKRFLRYDGHNVPIMYNEKQNKVMLVYVDAGDTRK